MSVFSTDKLIEQTRQLAASYYEQLGQALPLTIELAKHDVLTLLGYKKPEKEHVGVDAVDSDKNHVLIKGRAMLDSAKNVPRIGQFNLNGDWDIVVLVLYNREYRPYEIYRALREDIETAIEEAHNPKREKRGAMSIAKFKAIGELIWAND